MKVVVAIDSFKGSMSSLEAGRAAAEGIKRAIPKADVTILPVADGGEGTTEALISGLGGEFHEISVTGPAGDNVMAKYGIVNQTAIMEMAQAAGLTLIPVEKQNPMHTTTYGLGEMILDAIEKGCNDFIIGIGGSATNDCGVGMLQALGFSFLDEDNHEVVWGAEGIGRICSISDVNVSEKVKKSTFKIACDVNNPLCGPIGCSAIFGPQKGANKNDIRHMDMALSHFAKLTKKVYHNADPDIPGSGAAGGLGFAFRTFLNASLKPGVQIVLEGIKLDQSVIMSDIVVTGEGKIDSQTLMGKAPIGVAKIAKKYDKKVIAFCGCAADDSVVCNENGIDAIFPITRGILTLEEAMKKESAMKNMTLTAEQVFRLL